MIYGVNRYAEVVKDLPTPKTLEVLLDPVSGTLLTPTRIFDRSGQIELWRFENPAIPSRHYAAITDGEIFFYSEVPEPLILATLAALDPAYLERPEAFLSGILDTSDDPIPETLVEDLLLWQESDRPYHEIRVGLLADQITARYGRKKVLEWYLNSAFYGNSIYGAAQAAEFYFGKDLKDLNLSECALLAAVGSFPALNPLDAPKAAKENQMVILEEMAAAGFISEGEAASAARVKLIYADPEVSPEAGQPAYIGFVIRDASQAIPAERLLRGGFLITSTLDYRLQDQITCTLKLMSLRVVGKDPELDPECEAARLLPKYQGDTLAETDSLELNLAVLDPVSGELLALEGRNTSSLPLTLDQPRLPGSLVTPFIYLKAFTQGFEPASLVWDIPLPESELNLEDLHPGCGQDCAYLGPVNIRTALVNDLLSPAVQTLHSQGGGQLRNTLALFGMSLQPGICQECSVFPESSPLEMVDLLQGYGVFANRGYLMGRAPGGSGLESHPAAVLRIADPAGVEYPLTTPLEERKIISEELAYLLNHVLSDQEAWLDPRDREFYRIGRPAGVKTGYVPGEESGWAIGYTPRLVVGAWAGLSGENRGGDVDPESVSSSLWRAVTQYASREEGSQGWEMPPGIITRDVCYPSGELPTDYCPRVVREVFITGYEPLVPDTLYQALEVNRETGLLASVFTPAEAIEQQVFLNVPPRAQDWAAQAGVPTAPSLYDLGDQNREQGGLTLLTPENLSFVRGRVIITGSIQEEDFISARLQFGPGLNPHSWLQIGDEISTPVERGYLGTWDTTELEEGIYALQLVLFKENQGIEKTSLLLSVDNTPPEIILITDLSGGEISYQPGKELLLEVQFTNSSEIERVEFRMDGEFLASRKVEPFLIPWALVPGDHVLTVKALDQAGNRADLKIEFRVVLEE